MAADTGTSHLAVQAAGSSRLGERVRQTARTVAREAGAAFARTPVEVLLGATAAVAFSVATQRDSMDLWAHVIAGVGIALPLTYAASALHERGLLGAPLRWALTAAVVAIGAAYGFLGLDTHREADAWRAWLLVGTAMAALLCVPLVGPAGDRRERAHRFLARLVARAAVVMAYAAALWIGLFLALAAINGLFELHMSGKAYGHLAAAVFMLMPPWAVAAGLPALVAPAGPWAESQLRWFRRIGALLLAPLVFVYLGIVYAYTVRVLVTGEVPKNLVSPVVIGAGLLILVTTLALEPTYEDERAAGLAWLVRMAAPLLLPLVVFAAWAVSTRVDQYGWTEFRYLRLLVLVLLGVYAAGALYRRIRRRAPPVTAVPAVAAVALLLAAIGPWSATAVARRSQTTSMRQLLAAAHRSSAAAPATQVAPVVFRRLTSGAAYVSGHFGWDALRAVVPWIGAKPTDRVGEAFYAGRIGIVERVEAGMTRVVNARLKMERGIPGIAGGTLFAFEVERPRPGRKGGNGQRGSQGAGAPVKPGAAAAAAGDTVGGGPGVRVSADSLRGLLVVVAPSGDTVAADLRPLMQALLQRSAAETGSPIMEGGRRGDRDEPVETGRAVDMELAPADVVQPLRRADGRAAGQLVLRSVELRSVPQRGARVPNGPGAAEGPGGIQLRSAGGFVILPPELAAPRR